MIQLGDITKISGYTSPPVNIIIGGSPCQDLSVAGRRAGLEGERSGLFMEQIRIIKEMREQDVRRGRADELIRPKYMVWENVPGAFSSNKSEDFRIVLEETARIVDKTAAIPRPPKGKWTNAGAIMGSGWSIAWRVLDAQFWGVPQRRRRIALVADFGGESAPEILFEREGVSGNLAESGAARETIAGNSENGVGTADYKGGKIFDARGNGNGRVCPTLTGDHESRITDYTAIVCMDTIVRRLTPLECERLQDFPDGWTNIGEWTDGKGKKRKTTDSARYKALGNSIAIPPWTWILQRLSFACGSDRTMASLFDGIGGFPLIWERLNGAGFCLWTSEIDEFCIAVTKRRFAE